MICQNSKNNLTFFVRASSAIAVSLILILSAEPSTQAAPKTAPSTKKHAMSNSPDYAVDVRPTTLAYSVHLNDWPIADSPGVPQGQSTSTRVFTSIINGRNTLTLHIAQPKHPSPRIPYFEVRVRNAEGVVFTYVWDSTKPHAPLPIQTEAHFETHVSHTPWTWQTGQKITLDAPTEQAINAQTRHLFDALSAKNAEEASALFAVRTREDGVVSGIAPAQAKQQAHEEWVQAFAGPHWRMDPADYAHLRYTLLAQGKVVLVQRADGGDVLRTVADPDGNVISYDIYLSLINGQWTIIR